MTLKVDILFSFPSESTVFGRTLILVVLSEPKLDRLVEGDNRISSVVDSVVYRLCNPAPSLLVSDCEGESSFGRIRRVTPGRIRLSAEEGRCLSWISSEEASACAATGVG